MATATQDPPAGTDEKDPFEGMGSDDQPTLEFLVGGKAVTGHKLTIVGGAVETERQFEKGETVMVSFPITITEIAFGDQFDSKTDLVVGCTRKQKGRIVGPPRFTAYEEA
jgi:hypothetical protein